MNEETTAPERARPRWRAIGLVLLAGLSVLIGISVVAPAGAAPFVSCNRPVYNGTVSAKVRCDAASKANVRLKVVCWIGPVPSATKYTPFVTIPAGSFRTLTFTSGGWCTSPAQTWVVEPQVVGA